MDFEKLFEGKSWPIVQERIGVMSVDTLNRNWVHVCDERGYLAVKSIDGCSALVGRMGKRDDGKFCVEIVVRATIENNMLRDHEFWYVDLADKLHHVQWLHEVMQPHLKR